MRLGQPQMLTGAGEVFGFRDLQEDPQGIDVHFGIVSHFETIRLTLGLY